jgi:hypothetical protein
LIVNTTSLAYFNCGPKEQGYPPFPVLIVFLVGDALCAVEHRVDDAVVIFQFDAIGPVDFRLRISFTSAIYSAVMMQSACGEVWPCPESAFGRAHHERK